MTYVFIDESGSLNNKSIGIFSVSLVFIHSDNLSHAKNYFKRSVKKFKKEMNIEIKDELKAHNFVKNKKIKMLLDFTETNKNVFAFSAYINNEDINKKFLRNKNVTYNFLVKLALERAIEKLFWLNNEEIEILADNRKIGTGSLNSLHEYLEAEFIVQRDALSSIKLDYIDSHTHWGIQLADFYSYANYYYAKEQTPKSNNRKVY